MTEIDKFMQRVFDAVNSPLNKCLEYDTEQEGIKLANPKLLSKTFEGICNINLANSFYNRMKTYGFRKRRVNGYDYFYNDQFNPHDESCLPLFQRNVYKHKIKSRKESDNETRDDRNDRFVCYTLEGQNGNPIVFMKPSNPQPQIIQFNPMNDQQFHQQPMTLPQQQTMSNQPLQPNEINQQLQLNDQPMKTEGDVVITQQQLLEFNSHLLYINERVSKIEWNIQYFKVIMSSFETNLTNLCKRCKQPEKP